MGKLNHYGVKSVAYSWFETYLKEIKRFVWINGFSSKDFPISHDVPQASVSETFIVSFLHQWLAYCYQIRQG